MKTFKFLVIIFFTLYVPSYGGTIDPSTPDVKYIEYGSRFNYVVRISGIYQDDKPYIASAVLIDDHHFLTAAHVVKDCKTCIITMKDKNYTISTVTINKDFDTEFGVGDIALGYCEDSFDLGYYPLLYVDDDETGKLCGIVGYGFTGTFVSGAVRSDGKKRGGSNIVDSIYRDMLICSPSHKGSKGFTQLEILIAGGDSGGGLFIDGKLAGIHSCVMVANRSPTSSYGEESGHTRVSKFIDWINENKTSQEK